MAETRRSTAFMASMGLLSRMGIGSGRTAPPKLTVEVKNHLIAIKGDLDGSPEDAKVLTSALSRLAATEEWEVDASDVEVKPEGVTLWIQVAREALTGVRLRYRRDYLGYVLQYDPRYDPSDATFAF